MIDVRFLDCCGIHELVALSHFVNPGTVEANVKHVLRNKNCAFYLFSCVEEHEDPDYEEDYDTSTAGAYGKIFADYIIKHKLGTVVMSDLATNPNSGNRLRAYLWTVDWDAAKKHLARKRIVKKKIVRKKGA